MSARSSRVRKLTYNFKNKGKSASETFRESYPTRPPNNPRPLPHRLPEGDMHSANAAAALGISFEEFEQLWFAKDPETTLARSLAKHYAFGGVGDIAPDLVVSLTRKSLENAREQR